MMGLLQPEHYLKANTIFLKYIVFVYYNCFTNRDNKD